MLHGAMQYLFTHILGVLGQLVTHLGHDTLLHHAGKRDMVLLVPELLIAK